MNSSILPKDFYWREYLVLYKDLSNITNKEDAINHYVNHGMYERREYKINKNNCVDLIPSNFDWEEYYLLYKDLNPNLKKNKKSCILHYLFFGKNKQYKAQDNSRLQNKKLSYKTISDRYNNNNTDYNNNSDNNNTNNVIFKNKKKYEIINNKNYNDEICLIDKVKCDDENYDLLEENDVIYTKVSNEKYLEFESDINVLDVLPSYNLIIDMNNTDCKDSFFINSIVSKYKTHSTFLILRFDQEKYYFNINNEYLINQFFHETDDVIKIIEDIKDKINKIFVNSFINYNENFIEYILNLPIYKIGTTSDFFKVYKDSLPFYDYVDLKNSKIDINKFDELINPNNYDYNLKLYSSFYHKDIKVVPFPYFNNKFKKYKTNNKQIICCLIGDFIESNIKTELENIILHFSERYKTINFVVFGNIDTKIRIESEKYNYISELNDLLIKYNPNVIIEMSNYNTNYCNNIQLSFITDLPIIYSKKNIQTYIKDKLSNYQKAYEFDTMDSLFYLISKHSQDYFYTILHTITYNKYWNDLWIINKEKIISQNEKNKYNVKPYFIYYPQFHETMENNVIYYKSYNDMKEINYFNDRNTSKLNISNNEYCPVENYDYIINEDLIQKQINLINDLDFNGIAVYYYWFVINTITNNNMIMDKVIDKLFSSDLDMYDKKIFFIWKNENLSNILNCGTKVVENVYNNSSFYKNGECLMKYFKNDKYLKIDNKPVFIINDIEFIQNVDVLYSVLNKLCIENGFSGINLILNNSNNSNNNENISFKHCQIYFDINNINNTNTTTDLLEFKNNRNELNYEKFVNDEYSFTSNKIQSIILDFDNSATIKKHIKSKTPVVCKNNTEMLKILYIKKIIECYNKNLQTDLDKLVLINSFNNWGEGSAFEPSEKYGYYNINLLNKLLKY
jgi:hypothetical protein